MDIKPPLAIKLMTEGGRISKQVLDYGLSCCQKGITTREIDKLIEQKMLELKVKPWFNTVNDYNFVSCISVNDSWLHGKPNDLHLKVGDVVKIDTGIVYEGYHTDNCWTIVIQDDMSNVDIRNCFMHSDKEIEKFLAKGANALFKAIDFAVDGGRLGNISFTLQNESEMAGYNVIRGFGGHGIGRNHWEDPQIPCLGTKGAGLRLQKGMVLAIEIMYTMGNFKHFIDKDKWTVKTADGKISAMFEHTVAITENGPVVLTN